MGLSPRAIMRCGVFTQEILAIRKAMVLQLELSNGARLWICAGIHYDDLLRSIAKEWYRIPVQDLYCYQVSDAEKALYLINHDKV